MGNNLSKAPFYFHFPGKYQLHRSYSSSNKCHSIHSREMLYLFLFLIHTWFFSSPFEGVYEPFRLAVTPWVICRSGIMVDIESFGKLSEFSCRELICIIRNNFVCQAIPCKQCMREINSHLGNWISALYNFWSFTETIHHYQIMWPIKWSRKTMAYLLLPKGLTLLRVTLRIEHNLYNFPPSFLCLCAYLAKTHISWETSFQTYLDDPNGIHIVFPFEEAKG